jgi:DNA repair protein RadC
MQNDELADKAGHRQRLRARFLNSARGIFPDYELLELLLCMAKPRGDVKPLAKALLREFNSFSGVITATKEQLMSISGVGESVVASLKLVEEASIRLAKESVDKGDIINSWSSLISYLKTSMAFTSTENFRVLYLDKQNALIADELQDYGTVDSTPVYPREIVKRALHHEATALILVHNHPSGSVEPSEADIELTGKIHKALDAIGVIIHDHVIIGSSKYYSFKSNQLL